MCNNSYKLLKYIKKETLLGCELDSDREMSKSWEPTNLGGSLGEMYEQKCVSASWHFPYNKKSIC